MKRLILTRHAKSSWDDPAMTDHDRPLNDRGKAAAAELGVWLAAPGDVRGEGWWSASLRAREPWAGLAPAPRRQCALSIGCPERLKVHLGFAPGSVSPFGLMHRRDHAVRVIIDRDLKSADRLSFHPNINSVTLTLAGADFTRFLAACGNRVQYVGV